MNTRPSRRAIAASIGAAIMSPPAGARPPAADPPPATSTAVDFNSRATTVAVTVAAARTDRRLCSAFAPFRRWVPPRPPASGTPPDPVPAPALPSYLADKAAAAYGLPTSR